MTKPEQILSFLRKHLFYILKPCFQQSSNKKPTFSFKKRFLARVIKEEQLKVTAINQKSSRCTVTLLKQSHLSASLKIFNKQYQF